MLLYPSIQLRVKPITRQSNYPITRLPDYQIYPIPPVRFPMQKRNFAVRMKICPSDTAGELSV